MIEGARIALNVAVATQWAGSPDGIKEGKERALRHRHSRSFWPSWWELLRSSMSFQPWWTETWHHESKYLFASLKMFCLQYFVTAVKTARASVIAVLGILLYRFNSWMLFLYLLWYVTYHNCRTVTVSVGSFSIFFKLKLYRFKIWRPQDFLAVLVIFLLLKRHPDQGSL